LTFGSRAACLKPVDWNALAAEATANFWRRRLVRRGRSDDDTGHERADGHLGTRHARRHDRERHHPWPRRGRHDPWGAFARPQAGSAAPQHAGCRAGRRQHDLRQRGKRRHNSGTGQRYGRGRAGRRRDQWCGRRVGPRLRRPPFGAHLLSTSPGHG
jgi:hypothetical protein